MINKLSCKGSDSKTKEEKCEFDEDCQENLTDEKTKNSYEVCSSNRCTLVTGECLEDSDCSVSNFLLYRLAILPLTGRDM